MAVFAEMEQRDAISKRTTGALAAARARGVKLGNPRLADAIEATNKARQEAADAFAAIVRPKRREQPPWSRQRPICSRDQDCSRRCVVGCAGVGHLAAPFRGPRHARVLKFEDLARLAYFRPCLAVSLLAAFPPSPATAHR
jgi:hypothetical protein